MNDSCGMLDISCWFAYLGDQLQHFFVWCYASVLSGLASLYALIPVPDFMLNVPDFSFPSIMLYLFAVTNMSWGIGIIVSAYVARFILRRIPFIGG